MANIAYGLLVLGLITAVPPRSWQASAVLAPILPWIVLATYYVWLRIAAGQA